MKDYIQHPILVSRYRGMINRCYNEKSSSYERYGGRGITVCDEWLNNRSAFIQWALANGYNDNLQIDRINNDGNYEPANCRWVSAKANCRNTSKTVKVEYEGLERPLINLCEELDINVDRIRSRVKNSNWDLEKAVSPLHNAGSIKEKLREANLKKALAAEIDKHLCFVHVIRLHI